MLIESKCGRILPDWMRFVKGVVDSEDLPLSISREKAQDTALLKRIERVLVRKVGRTQRTLCCCHCYGGVDHVHGGTRAPI